MYRYIPAIKDIKGHTSLLAEIHLIYTIFKLFLIEVFKQHIGWAGSTILPVLFQYKA